MLQETDNENILSETTTPSSDSLTVQERQFRLNQAFKEYSKGKITEEALREQEAELEVDYAEAFLDQTSTIAEILPTLKRWIEKLTGIAGK